MMGKMLLLRRHSLKLFPNSQLSLKESVILLLGIVTRHQLTGVALEDILGSLRNHDDDGNGDVTEQKV